MLGSIWSHLWRNVRPLTAQQRFLFFVGSLLLASAVVHGAIAIGALITGQEWSGPLSWRKPVVFAMSFGMLSITAGWILRSLPVTRWGWVPTIVLGAFSLLEVSAITLQTWRGVPSHFNTETLFDTVVFGIMALSVYSVVVALVFLLIWVAVRFRGNSGERLAAIVGLIGLLAAGYIGNKMIDVGQAQLDVTGTVPYEVVFGADGSAKLSHFVGMHLIQFLAVLAILTPAYRRLAVVAIGAIGGLAVFASVSMTAFAGSPWLTPDAGTGALGLFGVVVSFIAVIVSVRMFAAEQVRHKIQNPAQVG